MNNYPNMSYCAIENTSHALRQVIELIRDAEEDGIELKEYLENVNSHERSAWDRLVDYAQEILEIAELHED